MKLVWIRDHSENIFGRVKAFLFSPTNSCPCHQATSYHVVLHHSMSFCIISCRFASYHVILCHVSDMFSNFHLVWRAYWFLLLRSGVMHTSWGKYAWIHVPVRGLKSFGPLWGSTFFKPIGGGGGQNVFRHLNKLLAMNSCRGRGGGIKWSPLGSQ